VAACPCCGESLPASAEPNELCALCSRAMDTGMDAGSPGPYGNFEQPFPLANVAAQSIPIQRPVGITIVALLHYILAPLLPIVAVCAIAGAVLHWSLKTGDSHAIEAGVVLGPLISAITYLTHPR